MLISMPTGTSTIFGVFQLIRVSPKQCWHDVRAGIKTRLTSNVAQARNTRRRRYTDASDPETSLLGKATSLLDKAAERKRRIDAFVASVTVREFSLPAEAILSKNGDFGRDADGRAEAATLGHRLSFAPQQSLSAVLLSALAPSACCAAVGSPCICRCVSCEDAATSPVF
jgi:hypothetical protein